MEKREVYKDVLKEARMGWVPEDFSKRVLIPDERLAIVSDVHVPYHDEDLYCRVLEECDKQHVETIVFLGDLMDMPTYSHYGKDDESTVFKRELNITKKVVELALDVVPTVYWSRGNHEQRWMKQNGNQVYMEQLANLVGLGKFIDPEDGPARLVVSDNPTLDADEGRWMLTHPAQFGKPLAVPMALATKDYPGQNVISGHTHSWGMTKVAGGKFIAAECGGLFNPKYHKYIQYSPNSFKPWVQGYAFLINGRLELR